MDWITSINRALRYVEEHLQDENLSVEAVAAVTAYSPFYLQRLFYILTEMSLSDYIRGRKLSMAGQELQATDARVLDTALRYGYETPESFSKAFRRFHGVTPSAAQEPSTSSAGVPMAAASRTTMGALSYTEGNTIRSARS